MLEELIMTLEMHEYLLLQGCEKLQRFWCYMGTLHTSHNAAIVDTNNITTTSSTLHP
jgi:hypothetical protein